MAEKNGNEEIIDEIVNRVTELEKENEKLKQRLEQRQPILSNSQNQKVSRRQFLKKLGAGAIGLGALGLAPAASWTRISDQGITRNGEPLYLGLEGSNSMAGDLNMGGHNITNTGSLDTDAY